MRFSFNEQIKSGAHLLAPGPAGVKGGFVGEFLLLLDGKSVAYEDTLPSSTVTSGLTAARSWWSTKVQSTRERQGSPLKCL